MPADSDTPGPAPTSGPALPHTWRPLGTRIAGYVGGFGLLAVCIGAWVALGPDLRAKFTGLERATMLGLGLLAAVVWYALVRPRLVARDEGLVVVNGFKRRELDYAQVLAVRLRRGAPWAEMDLSDGTSIPVMAIQGSDGPRATTAVRQVRALIADRAVVSREIPPSG